MDSLRGKVVVVTGGTAGIGLVVAEWLAGRGARVVVCGRDQQRLAGAVAALPGGLGLRCDLVDAADRALLVRTVTRCCARIDALVNVAPPTRIGRLVQLAAPEAERSAAHALDLTRLVLPHMADHGCVVLLSSLAGASPPLSRYTATKAGVHDLVDGSAPRGLRVHLLRAGGGAPGGAGLWSWAGAAETLTPRGIAGEIKRCLTAR
ncbi:SDR family NAD(P)-dependent oxidoreductase [Saccharothrix obliqua]|uniref:SDR family NAD(P)-dependent oxidoreductase n=1 Tax=Saccharothrix obliqua TaxID=2861747 RepID=UPI001C5EB50F|nr:SDR family oxidoreductase [Saccharothrix obliqua]MBW4720464.1 SDR family oxidoreductase [Saccharothrix obliqua]